MNVIVFILICYGACNNIVYGSIFKGFRDTLAKFGTGDYSLNKLFSCMMCLSTWMGFAISAILIYTHNPTPFTINNVPLCIFLHGLLATGSVWLLHTLQEWLEK